MAKLTIKKGDTVQVIAGANKGHKGAVLDLDHTRLRVRVQGYGLQTKYDQQEGKIERERFIDYSNVKLVSAAEATAKKKTTKKAASK